MARCLVLRSRLPTSSIIRADRHTQADQGFSLVEVVIAMSITMVVLVGVGVFLGRGIHETADNEQRQAATVLADSTLEYARALPPTKLLDGRTSAAVTAQIALAATKASWTDGDPRIVNGAAVPATLALSDDTQSVAGTRYLVRTFVSACYPAGGSANACTAAVTSARKMYRITASVRWNYAPGQCTEGSCEVLVDTLLDADQNDPLFAVSS